MDFTSNPVENGRIAAPSKYLVIQDLLEEAQCFTQQK
jgi:hypothetical protein